MTVSLATLLSALGLALASMALYALGGGRRDADAAGKRSQFAGGAGDFLVHWLMWLLRPVEAASLRLGLTPDLFNFAGLGLGLLSGVLIGSGRVEAGGWAIALGGVCDVLDGRLARAMRVDSAYGKFIDSTLDRFVEVFALLGLAAYLRGFAWGPWMAAAAMAGSLLVSYTRARGESLGVVCKEGLMQRAERIVLMFVGCLADAPLSARFGWAPGTLLFWVLAVIALGTCATAVQRTLWISRRLRRG